MRVGLDIGSTTLKCVVLDKDNKIVYTHYERHLSQIAAKTAELIDRIRERFPEEKECPVCISGTVFDRSAGSSHEWELRRRNGSVY